MTDEEFVFESAPPPPTPGTYPATIKEVEPITLDTVQGPNQALLRWTLEAVGEDGEVIEVDALSSRSTHPRAKASKWLASLGKTPKQGGPGVPPSELAGLPCLAVIGLDDEGFARLEDIVAPPKGRK